MRLHSRSLMKDQPLPLLTLKPRLARELRLDRRSRCRSELRLALNDVARLRIKHRHRLPHSQRVKTPMP